MIKLPKLDDFFYRYKYGFALFLLSLLIFICFLGVSSARAAEEKPESSNVENKTDKKIFTLEEAIQLAALVHPELKSAFALRNAAKAQLTRSRARWYPNVALNSSYGRTESRNITTSTGTTTIPGTYKSDSYRTSLSLSQKIYDFGRTRYSVMAARENLKSSDYDLLITADDIILKIRENYYNAVAAEKVLDVTKETVQQQELHLKQAKGFFQVGKRSKIEVTKAEVDLANARLDLIKAENLVKLTRLRLAYAIGITGQLGRRLDDQVRFTEIKMDYDRAMNYAREHRPDLLKIRTQERLYRARLLEAKARWYPTLNGNASYGYNDDKLLFRRNSWSWGVSLDFDVFTGGSRSATIDESGENLKSLSARKVRLWQTASLEVEQAYLNLDEARKRISVLEKSLGQARENFDLAQGRYEVGVGDNLQFADARLALQQAKIDLITSILDYQIARARLEKAVGVSVFRSSFKNLINK